jgi:hypothetical protein
LTPETRLAPNLKQLAAKVMDGEAIIINLTNGIYYSMDEVGGLVWELIVDGCSLEQIGAAISRGYDVSAGQALADLEPLAAKLLDEDLVSVVDSADAAQPSPRPEPAVRLPYEAPTLHKYRDMADLLALDPPMPGQADIPWQPSAGQSPGRE